MNVQLVVRVFDENATMWCQDHHQKVQMLWVSLLLVYICVLSISNLIYTRSDGSDQ